MLANNTYDLQELVTSINEIAVGLVLSISSKKTKNMLIGEHPKHSNVSTVQSKKEVMENFTYYGSSINNQSAIDHEIISRIGKASATFSQLNKIWSCKKWTVKTKFHFY